MDVPSLLQAARQRAHLNQTALAERAATGPSAISAYESGARSPTVRTLDRLLAACDLQARVQLIPLLAELDERVDALTALPADPPLRELQLISASLDLEPSYQRPSWLRNRVRTPPRWAIDGATALALHGFSVPSEHVRIVVAWDEHAASWVVDECLQAFLGRDLVSDWHELDWRSAATALAGQVHVGQSGVVEVRVVNSLPATVAIQPPGASRSFPVLSLEEVGLAFEEHRETLDRWRQRTREAAAGAA